ncbi:phage virion morphogenesis protein [Vibrio fluvialis]|uniref:phage virion morphogenesis protein n=1 Tax=Vibrio fluvialis TaxID=676 RepID=UPI003D7ECF7E
MIQVRADERSYLRLIEQLKLLFLNQKSRKRILNSLGKQLKKKTKANMRSQRDPDGHAWKKRKRGRGKMFKGLQKKVSFRQTNNNRDLQVGWFGFSSYVAARHHLGKSEQSGIWQIKKAEKEELDKDSSATRVQAKQLKELNYRLEPQGTQKRGKKPTIRWIVENMTRGEAAKTIQELENKTPARDWEVGRPERRLIGVSPKRLAMMIKRELKRNRSK